MPQSTSRQVVAASVPRNHLYLDQEVARIWRPLAVPSCGQHSRRAISTNIVHLPARVVVTYPDTIPPVAERSVFSLAKLKGMSEPADDRRYAEQDPHTATL